MAQPTPAADAAQGGAEVRKALDTLTNIQRAADATGGAGTGNSNDILDQGEPALAFFDRFSPLYQAVDGRFRKMPDGDTSAKFVRDRYDEQRDIDFGAFAADAEVLRKAAETHQDQFRTTADKLGDLWHGWAGPAAAASQQSFAALNQRASQCGDGLAGVAEVLTDATHTVSKIVIGKAVHVLHSVHDPDAIAGMTPDQVKDLVDVAHGDHDDDKLRRACGYFQVDIADRGDADRHQAMVKAGEWVSQVFCPRFESAFDAVIRICDDTKQAVDEAWQVLTDHLARTPAGPGQPPPVPPPSVPPPAPVPPPAGAPTQATPVHDAAGPSPAASAGGQPAAGAGAPAEHGAPTFTQAAGFSTTGGVPAAGPADSFAGVSHDGAVGLGSMQDVGADGPQGATGLRSMGDSSAGAESDTGPPGAAQAAGPPNQGQDAPMMMAPMGGMGMMGGMGAITGAARNRSNASPWQQGDIFADGADGAESSDVRFRSVLGDTEEKAEPKTRNKDQDK